MDETSTKPQSADDGDMEVLTDGSLKRKPDHELRQYPTKKITVRTADNETKIRTIILNEVMTQHDKEQKLSIHEKQTLIEFAYKAHIHLLQRENSDVSLSVKIDNGFKALSRRIDALERSQKAEMEKGHEHLTVIDTRCKNLEVQTIPSEAQQTYAKICARVNPPTSTDKVKPIVQTVNVETKNRFAVLEIEDDWKVKDDADLNGFKKILAKSFHGKKVKIEKVIKTKSGNVSLEFPDDAEKVKAEEILKREAPHHSTLRETKKNEPMTHIALRGVPVYVDETMLRNQLRSNNDEYTIFKKPETALRAGGEILKPNQKTRTWKLSIPRSNDARKMVRQGWLLMDLEAITVELWSPGPRRCTACFSTSHLVNKPNRCKDIICNICADRHPTKECKKSKSEESFKCFVCAMQRLNNNHRATVKDCPVLKKEMLEEAKKAADFLHDE